MKYNLIILLLTMSYWSLAQEKITPLGLNAIINTPTVETNTPQKKGHMYLGCIRYDRYIIMKDSLNIVVKDLNSKNRNESYYYRRSGCMGCGEIIKEYKPHIFPDHVTIYGDELRKFPFR